MRAFLVVLPLLAACARDREGCLLMAYPHTLGIAFDPQPDAPGRWDVAVQAEALDVACSITLPSAEWPYLGDAPPCGDSGEYALILTDDGAALAEVRLWNDTPAAVSFTVSHEDEILLDADYTPVYDVEPGSCGTESRNGTLVVEVPAPGA